MTTGHRQLDHTADLALELWAPTEEELLAEGARALVGLLTEGADVEARVTRAVTIDAVDAEDRLVQWLNEVLYAAVVEGFLTAAATITLRDGGLDAELRGEADAADRVRAELKSVTYHDLALEPPPESRPEGPDAAGAGLWRARVVVDV